MKKSFIYSMVYVFFLIITFMVFPITQKVDRENKFKQYFTNHVQNNYQLEKNYIRDWAINNNSTAVKKI